VVKRSMHGDEVRWRHFSHILAAKRGSFDIITYYCYFYY